MGQELSKEFIEIMGKIRKLNYQFKPTLKMPHGEFIMLCTIDQMMNNKNRKGYSELGVKVSELSHGLDASRPATSKMLNNIEDKQYIVRVADKVDRRVVYIHLTEKGSAILKQHSNDMEVFIQDIVNKVGESDTLELIRIFNNLYEILAKEHCIMQEKSKEESDVNRHSINLSERN